MLFRHYLNLHSTMYLLKLNLADQYSSAKIFTFHHVSIKTLTEAVITDDITIFTFHHVSIKTHIIIILELPLLFNVILSTS